MANSVKDVLKLKKESPKKVETLSHAKNLVEQFFIDYFSDENGDSWIQYKDNNSKRFHQVMSQEFEDFVRVKLCEISEQPREHWATQLIKLFDSMARRNKKKKLYLKTCEDEDRNWLIQINFSEAIKIDIHGEVSICELPPKFRLFTHQREVDVDLTASINDINLLDKYFSMPRNELELLKDTLPVEFIPNIAKPIKIFQGPPGSAKTTSCSLFVKLIDPSYIEDGKDFPQNDGDWFSSAREHPILFLDNISYLDQKKQDKCCRVITGTSVKQRKLYTNFGTVSTTIKCSLLINGIELSGLKSDFLDRSLMYNLDRISDDKRKHEVSFWKEFEKDRSKILGAIFKIIGKARNIVDSVSSPKGLRLIDFAKYASACSQARGRDKDEFLESLQLKIQLQKDESIVQSTLAQPLIEFVNLKREWSGNASQLLDELTKSQFGVIQQSVSGQETVVVKNVPKWWNIRSPNSLGTELTRISFLLRSKGIKMERTRTGLERIIKLVVTPVTAVTYPSFIDEKKAMTRKIDPLSSVVTEEMVL